MTADTLLLEALEPCIFLSPTTAEAAIKNDERDNRFAVTPGENGKALGKEKHSQPEIDPSVSTAPPIEPPPAPPTLPKDRPKK